MKTIFDFHEVPYYKKVKLVANKLKGRAFVWWRQLQVQRVRMRKGKVQEWFKMKRQLQKQFLPFQNLHRKPQETKYQQVQVLGSNLGQPRMIIGRPRRTRKMQQSVLLLMRYLVYQRQLLHASMAQGMEFQVLQLWRTSL